MIVTFIPRKEPFDPFHHAVEEFTGLIDREAGVVRTQSLKSRRRDVVGCEQAKKSFPALCSSAKNWREFIIMKGLKQQVLACITLLLFLGNRKSILVNSFTDYETCTSDVRRWAETKEEIVADFMEGISSTRWETKDFLFFLHLPTTGGRTFNRCFLQHLFSPEEQCPKSYEGLEIDLNHPQCKCTKTHDDLSLLSQFPPDLNKTVIGSMRNSMDRILSAHEFSIEVAVQRLHFPGAARDVLEVWPWKYLVPLMQEDLLHRQEYPRRKANQSTGFLYYLSAVYSSPGPSGNFKFFDILFPSPLHYNLPSDNMLSDQRMPLKEFINHPMAHAYVHNGATFQVAGLTDHSCTDDAQMLRDCVAQFPDLEDYILKVAKRILECMLFLGLTESQHESVKLFTSRMTDEILIKVYKNMMRQSLDKPCTHYDLPHLHGGYLRRQELIQEVLEEYESCSASYRQELLGVTSIRFPSVNFPKDVEYLPNSLVQEVMALNRLDTELFDYLQLLFDEQRTRLSYSERIFEDLESDVPQVGDSLKSEMVQSIDFLLVVLLVTLFVVMVLYFLVDLAADIIGSWRP